MEEYLKQLDPNLRYIKYEIADGILKIYCETKTTDDNPFTQEKNV